MKQKKLIVFATMAIVLLTILSIGTMAWAAVVEGGGGGGGTSSHTHNYNIYQKTISNATCTKNAVKQYKCVYCSLVKNKEVSGTALGHKWSSTYMSDNSNHWKFCTRSGCTATTSKGAHNTNKQGSLKTAATCTKAAVYYYGCSTCGRTALTTKSVGDKNPSNHGSNGFTTKTDARVIKKQADLCYTVTSHYTCNGCGKKYKADYTNSVKTHSFPTTWTKLSNTHYRVCTICGYQQEYAHKDDNKDGKCDTCGYDMNSVTIIKLEKVSLSYSASTIYVGGSPSTATATSKLEPSNATGVTRSYSSNNTAVAKVSSSGQVTAVSEGTAVITVKAVQEKTQVVKSATFTIYVKKSSGGTTDHTHKYTKTVSTKYTKIDSNQHQKEVTYECTNTVGTCNAKTTIIRTTETHDAGGNIKYTVYDSTHHTYMCMLCGYSEKQSCNFGTTGICKCGNKKAGTTQTISNLVVTPTKKDLAKDNTFQIMSSVSTSDGKTPVGVSYVYKSSDTSYVTVSSTGLVKAIKDGPKTVTITVRAKQNGVEKLENSVVVNVTAAPTVKIASLSVTPSSSKTISKGESFKISSSVYTSDGKVVNGVTFTYDSSNKSYVTVDSSGNVKAIKNGSSPVSSKITVTATKDGQYLTKSFTVTVNAAPVADLPELKGVSLSYANGAKIEIGKKYTPTIVTNPKNLTGTVSKRFSSNNYGAITLNTSTGEISGVSVGKATIKVVVTQVIDGKIYTQEAECPVEVVVSAGGIVPVGASKTEVRVGESITLNSGNISANWTVESYRSGGKATVYPIKNANRVTLTGLHEGSVLVKASAQGYTQGVIEIAVEPASSQPTDGNQLLNASLSYTSTLIYVNDTANAILTFEPSSLKKSDMDSITFSSSQPSIVKVDPSSGLVIGLKPGTSEISCKIVKGPTTIIRKVKITVREETGYANPSDKLIARLYTSQSWIEMPEGTTKKVTITYDGDGKISLINRNTNVAVGSYSNKVVTITAKKVGSTTIDVNASEGTKYQNANIQIHVTVVKADNSGTGDSGGTPTSGTGGGGSGGTGIVESGESYTMAVRGEYNGIELSTNEANRTQVPLGSIIKVTGLPTDKITQMTAQWDESTNIIQIIGSAKDLPLPENFTVGSNHILNLTATDGKQQPAKQTYYITIVDGENNPEEKPIDVNVEYSGDILNPAETTIVNPGDPLKIIGEPADKIIKIVYIWDLNEPVGEINGSSGVINVPDTFAPGSTHKLFVQAYADITKEPATKEYTFTIPGNQLPGDNPLEVLPWEAENFELTQVAISLRNDSLSDKGNKNIYALNEEVTYFVDFKNGGDDITDVVTITLRIPLTFEIIDAAGGEVNTEAGLIIWTYPEGMKKGYSGTKVVRLRYTALSDSSLNGETIYPLASILVRSDVKDKSAVINYIYRDPNITITAMHSPYMYGDQEKPTFRPDYTITRAEGALVLARILLGQDVIDNTQVAYTFPDITETYLEAQRAITACTTYGIIKGYNDGTYRPNQTMTRAEFMKILATFLDINTASKGIEGLEIKDYSKLIKVYNNPVSQYIVNGEVVTKHWAVKEITLLTRLNMTPASSFETDLRIDQGISRAEVSQQVNYYLLRAPAKVDENYRLQFRDITTYHKLIGDVVEATRPAHYYTLTSDGYELGK